jgi:hypothetical protein
VAESRQFGGGRVFGDGISPVSQQAGDDCSTCEAMLADALDGTLTPDEQASFELHAADCTACGCIVADARRGAAWLEMLRHPAPEPPLGLLERILAQTSIETMHGAELTAERLQPNHVVELAAYASGAMPERAAHAANILPFPRNAIAAMRRNALGQLLLQPRLAMTAAMAFFSIALTLNITGFNAASLRASDLKPGSLRRDVVSASSNVVRYYESLRVVYELESRVRDLQNAQDSDAAGSTPPPEPAPAAPPASQPEEHRTQPPAHRQSAPGTGSSQWQNPDVPHRLAVSRSRGMRRSMPSRVEGRQV